MRRTFFIFLFSLFTFHFSPSVFAETPEKGFYGGPYITLSIGSLDWDWDVNQRTGIEEGSDQQLMMHLSFGWNLTDWLAPELQVRYGSDANSGRREYLAGANAGLNFTLPWKPLISFESLRILPFLRTGLLLQVASLPGDSTSTDNRITSTGLGGSIGGGVRFLFHEYLYFGLEIEQDWIHHEEILQVLPTGLTVIYQGGWKDQIETMVIVGVHF